MKGNPPTEGMIRGRLENIFRTFKAHGKHIEPSQIKELVERRLEEGPPYLGEMLLDMEERDYRLMLQVLKFNEASDKGKEDKKSSKSKSKTVGKRRGRPKKKLAEDLTDVEVALEVTPEAVDEDEVDLDDI